MKELKLYDSKEKIQAILNQQEYQAYHVDNQTLWSRLLGKLNEKFNDWIDQIAGHFNLTHATSTTVLYTIISILIIVIGGIIIWILFRTFGKGQRVQSVGTALDLAESSSSHLERAQVAFDNGDTLTAVRHAFLALIRQLDGSGWIEAKTWKTNKEYHEELLSKDMKMAQSFFKLAEFFDQTVYGGELPSTEDYINYRTAVMALIEWARTPREQEGLGL